MTPADTRSWHEFSLIGSLQKLLIHQRHEQSDFTLKKSTVDRIPALADEAVIYAESNDVLAGLSIR